MPHARSEYSGLHPMSSLQPSILNLDWYLDYNTFFERMEKTPPANIKEKDNHFEVELAVPGMDKNDFNIEIGDNLLTVSAECKIEKNVNYTRKEFSYSSFSRSFKLPSTVNADAIMAEYKNGLLGTDTA